MTLEEAIEKLTLIKCPSGSDWQGAINLGIEALKAVKLEREIYAFERIDTLPGETREI